jgi:putative transposase
MTQFEITVDESLLPALFGQGDGLKVLMEQVLNQVLAAQVTNALQAQPGERTPERTGYRNGFRERRLQTRIGTLTLSVPRTRSGEFSPELWARYQRSEQAFVLALCEMVLQGVSTRKIEAVTQELCGAEFSKSTVSALCARLDPLVKAWNGRPLGSFPFVLVDALVVKVREDGQVRPCALMIASGIDEEGHRHLLGFALGDRESESSWREFFLSLKERGLSGVDLLVSDSHSGLVKAAHSCFAGACWQRCQVHFLRNLADACPKAQWEALLASAKQVLYAPDPVTARGRMQETRDAFEGKCPKAVALLESAFDDVTAVLALPSKYHRHLRTTNSMERTNEEVRRRERVIRIFPNRQSCERLLGALLMEFDEQMSCGKVYVGMEEYIAWRTARSAVQMSEPRFAEDPEPHGRNHQRKEDELAA